MGVFQGESTITNKILVAGEGGEKKKHRMNLISISSLGLSYRRDSPYGKDD